MLTIKNLKYIFILLFLCSCESKTEQLNINNKELTIINEVMQYKNHPYSGILFSKIDTLTTYKASYKDGIKHGKEEKFFFNGDLAELRFYTNGKKSGTHKAWWNNGQLMLEHHYNEQGEKINVLREWHSTGQLVKEMNYVNGEENGTQKTWDYTGKITSNYVVINGDRFGLIGSQKCKPDGYVD